MGSFTRSSRNLPEDKTMNDTSSEMTKRMEEMFQQKTSAERLLMGCSMFDLSKQMVKSSILEKNSKISSVDLRRELFLIFYGNDLDANRKRKILAHLTRSSNNTNNYAHHFSPFPPGRGPGARWAKKGPPSKRG